MSPTKKKKVTGLSYIDKAVLELAGANPFAKKDDAPAADSGGGSIANVAMLRKAMANFGRVPGPARDAALGRIKAAVSKLGAGELAWVKSFLARQGSAPASGSSSSASPAPAAKPNPFAK